MGNESYYLMRKDIPVCEFSLERKENGGRVSYSVENAQVLDEKKLPLDMLGGFNLGYYLQSRLMPVFGGYVGHRIIVGGDYLANSLENIIEYTGAFSLVDDFWLRRADDDKAWSEYNLFDNEIDDNVSLLAFTEEGVYEAKGFIRSPEFTTDGMLDKAWRQIDGIIYLYKASLGWGGRRRSDEQFSEFYSAQIAERLGLRHVVYDLGVWKGRLCSICELFTSADRSYIAAKKCVTDIRGFLRGLDRDSKLYQEFADTILFDAVVGNKRHTGNLGFIQDNDSMELIGLSPIFDNGKSLFVDVPDLRVKTRYTSRYYMISEWINAEADLEEIRELLTDKQRDAARLMDGFEFRRHGEFNLSERRLVELERIVQERARALL